MLLKAIQTFLPFSMCLTLACSSTQKKDDLNEHARTSQDQAKTLTQELGYNFMGAFPFDMNGDGLNEVVAGCEDDEGFRVCIFDVDGEDLKLNRRLGTISAQTTLSMKDLGVEHGLAGLLLVENQNETPDESYTTLTLYRSGSDTPLFQQNFYKRDSKDNANFDLNFSKKNKAWALHDFDNDGDTELGVFVRHQEISIPNRDGAKRVATGAYFDLREFEAIDGSWELNEGERDVLLKGLVQQSISSVEATSGKPYPELDAIVPGEDAEAQEDPKNSESAKLVNDGDLETGWVEDIQGAGIGEALKVKFEGSLPINMIRIVPGCVGSRAAYQKQGRPTQLNIRGGRFYADINLAAPKKNSGNVLGVLPTSIPGYDYAKQYLIFFTEAIESDELEIEILKTRSKRQRETCISEVVVY